MHWIILFIQCILRVKFNIMHFRLWYFTWVNFGELKISLMIFFKCTWKCSQSQYLHYSRLFLFLRNEIFWLNLCCDKLNLFFNILFVESQLIICVLKLTFFPACLIYKSCVCMYKHLQNRSLTAVVRLMWYSRYQENQGVYFKDLSHKLLKLFIYEYVNFFEDGSYYRVNVKHCRCALLLLLRKPVFKLISNRSH
jgi:hypothetical protein